MKFSDAAYARATFPSVVDSTIVLASACPTKFFLERCLNLAPHQKSIHLHAGGAFAHAIQVIREQFYMHGKPLDLAQLEGMRQFINFWGDYESPHKSYKTFENMLAAVFDYFRVYNPETDHVQPLIKADGNPAVEFTFGVPIPVAHPTTGEPIIYAGRCDMLGVLKQKMRVIVDEKTTYSFTEGWSKNFAMRGQFLGYNWAAQQFDIDVRAAVVRGIGIQVRDIKHQEAILTFPQWQIDRWYREMIQKVEYLKDCWVKNEYPVNYGDICSSYGGCAMMDLCTSPRPEAWFDTFAVRPWNPLDPINKGVNQ